MAVMCISQSQLGFKSQFELIWQFELKYKDSIQNTAILFEIPTEIFTLRLEKDLNRGKSLRTCGAEHKGAQSSTECTNHQKTQ